MPAAVMTDFQMPEVDGLGLTRWIRQHLPRVPVIVTSGRMEEPTERGFQALGIAHIMPKPFSEESLLAALRHVLPG